MQARIRQIITEKKTNIIVSADLTKCADICELIAKIGHKILGVKLHSDVIEDYDDVFIAILKGMAKEMNFLIIEDRKFCDIGNTVKLQSKKITKYADLITVHSVSGPRILDGLRENCLKNDCGILLLAQMSSKGNLIDESYTKKTVEMAETNRDIVAGFIGQQHLADGFLTFTPGVKIGSTEDNLGQQYNTPEYVITEKGSDVLIVGRGIYQSDDMLAAVDKYIFIKI